MNVHNDIQNQMTKVIEFQIQGIKPRLVCTIHKPIDIIHKPTLPKIAPLQSMRTTFASVKSICCTSSMLVFNYNHQCYVN